MKCLSFTCFLANKLALIHLSLNCISAINYKVKSHHLEIIEEWKNTVEIVKNSCPCEGKLVAYQFLVGTDNLFSKVVWGDPLVYFECIFFFTFFFYYLWVDPQVGSKSREELLEWVRAHWTALPKGPLGCPIRRDQKSLARGSNPLKPKGGQGYFTQRHQEGRGEILGRGEIQRDEKYCHKQK